MSSPSPEQMGNGSESNAHFDSTLLRLLMAPSLDRLNISPIRKGWSRYCEFVQQNQGVLSLVDQAVSTLLFWAPYSSSSRNRELLYGLLSVHHLLVDTALEAENERNSYGTSVHPNTDPLVPANGIRRLLTLTHNLLPAVLEFSSQSTRARLYLERGKFALRMILLVSYWRQLYYDSNGTADKVVGLLRRGGMYYPELPNAFIPTVEDQQHRVQRTRYVGRRTGRRVVIESTTDTCCTTPKNMWLRLVMGEILHCYRPLFWANTEDRSHRSSKPIHWKSWLVAVTMDLVSLQCLEGMGTNDNPWGKAEWNRRRLKLLLYLLRSPAWDRGVFPVVDRIATAIERVPVLGGVASSYPREWLIHWKHPLFAEED